MDDVADGQWDARNRTWMVLDELRELGKVPGLADFINKGRSRGVCTVLGFQDYLGLKEAFGENIAHEITATCAHRMFLRLGGESAEWASRSIGKAEIVETTFSFSSGSAMGYSGQDGKSSSTTYGPGGSSYSTGDSSSTGFNFNLSSNVTCDQHVRVTDAVLDGEISSLPDFEEGGGITGFVCQRSETGKPVVRQVKMPAEVVLSGLIPESDDPGFEKWEESELEW